MVFSLSDYKKLADRRTKVVPVSIGEVKLRAATALDQFKLREQFGDEVLGEQQVEFGAALLARCVINGDDENFLTAQQVGTAFPADDFMTLVHAAIELSGLQPKEAPSKNSRANRRR